jgi:hypothetical protein
MGFDWDNGAHDRLVDLCRGSGTAKELADVLSKEFGYVSRNAVIGHARRQGIALPGGTIVKTDRAPRRKPVSLAEVESAIKDCAERGLSLAATAAEINRTFDIAWTKMMVYRSGQEIGVSFSGGDIPIEKRIPDWMDRVRDMVRDQQPVSVIASTLGIAETHLRRTMKREGLVAPDGRRTPRRRGAITFGSPEACDLIAAEPKPPRPVVNEVAPETAIPFGQLDAAFQKCRWPYGDRLPYRYCGCQVKPGRAYCEAHQERSASKAPPKPLKPVFDVHNRPAPRRTVFA